MVLWTSRLAHLAILDIAPIWERGRQLLFTGILATEPGDAEVTDPRTQHNTAFPLNSEGAVEQFSTPLNQWKNKENVRSYHSVL